MGPATIATSEAKPEVERLDPSKAEQDAAWLATWLDAVAAGKATMSQRIRASIDAHGGLTAAIEAARARGVHLLELTDDKGNVVVAASKQPFRTLC